MGRKDIITKEYKEDRLLPIITVVVYFGADSWEAPRSLHEMLVVQDDEKSYGV